MHGVKKTKSDEAAQAAKQQDRSRKMKIYLTAKERLVIKHKSGEFDNETLELTSKMLERNPDIYSFWNWRRLALLKMKDDQTQIEDFKTQLAEEFRLTETCLRENPKSYGAWHHRGWVLGMIEEKNYGAEIDLCNKALELDERNFHCWDYRRLVVKLANKSTEDELKFSDNKLAHNFSNYSAWHYRSSLLSYLYPDDQGNVNNSVIHPTRLLKELELAKNAFFTDPEDQSAWFYSTWLLQEQHNADAAQNKIKVELATLHPAVDCDPRFHQGRTESQVQANTGGPSLTVCFTSPVERDQLNDCLQVNDVDECGEWWHPCEEAVACLVWMYTFKSALPESATYRFSSLHRSSTDISFQLTATNETFIDHSAVVDEFGFDTEKMTPALKQIWEDLLKTSTELALMEPDVKWPLLISVACQRRLSGCTNLSEIGSKLHRLSQLDSARSAYYSHLDSELRVGAVFTSATADFERMSTVKLSSQQLCSLPRAHLFSFVRVLDISNNQLTSVAALQFAVNLVELTANECRLSSLQGLENSRWLRFVSVAMNDFSNASQILPHLKNCKSLKTLLFPENAVSEDQNEVELIVKALPDVHCIPFWL